MALTRDQKIAIAIPLSVAVIGAAVTLGPKLFDDTETKAGVKIDAISIRDPRGRGQIVDVKVRNAGTAVAFLTKARFSIQAARHIPFCPLPHASPSSYTYDVEFPWDLDVLSRAVEHDISQSIPKDNVDRFEFRLGTAGKGLGFNLYQVRLSLVYNGGEGQTPKSDPFLVALEGQTQADAFTTTGLQDGRYRDCLKDFVANSRAILRLPGTRTQSLRGLAKEADKIEAAIRKYEAEQ